MSTKEKTEDFKAEYERIFKENIKREGADKLLEYMKTTDFFTSPASTKYHSNYPGGLCEHCVKVYYRFVKMLECEHGTAWIQKPENAETAAVIALLHDICKTNCYKTETRNVKNDATGQWEKKPYFLYEDQLPYGHGEKSVYMISAYMHLTRDEAMCINWHMGGFDARNGDGRYTVSDAFQRFPIAALFHASDFLTTYLDERIEK